jgi:hypothetical protein
VLASVVFSLITLQIYTGNNAKYINKMGHDVKDTLEQLCSPLHTLPCYEFAAREGGGCQERGIAERIFILCTEYMLGKNYIYTMKQIRLGARE